MKIKTAQAFFIICIVVGVRSAFCDHALLTDGRVFYNVMVPDGSTTGGGLIRIRTGSMSFGYDPHTNTVFTLPSHSVIDRVADYVSTSTVVGREKATAMVQRRRWDRYIPAPKRTILVAPTPAPKATPIPAIVLAEERPVPLNVVSDTVPLETRLNRQLDIFMKEQTTLAQDATTSVAQGLIPRSRLVQAKVELLQQQKGILEQYYPTTTETVHLAIEYWGEQVERARQTGRFDLENL